MKLGNDIQLVDYYRRNSLDATIAAIEFLFLRRILPLTCRLVCIDPFFSKEVFHPSVPVRFGQHDFSLIWISK